MRLRAPSLLAWVPLGVCFAAGVMTGCGDEVVCPTGTGGSPCRYTEGPGSPPTLLPTSDAIDATDVIDEIDVGGADDTGEDIAPEITDSGDVEAFDDAEDMDSGDVERLDAAETNEGQDTEPTDDADDGDIDADPSDARAGMAGSTMAHDETPDVMLAGGSVRVSGPRGSARHARLAERFTEEIDDRSREPAPTCGGTRLCERRTRMPDATRAV